MTQTRRLLSSLVQLPTNDALTMPWIARELFSADECARIVTLGVATQAERARTDREVPQLRDSEVRWLFPAAATSWLFDRLEGALLAANQRYRMDLTGFFEGVQIARYAEEGHYGWHMDIGGGRYSTRKLSMSVQLSDTAAYDGGDLQFRGQPAAAPRDIGTLIVFPSFLEHRVTPVTRGERYSMVSWVAGPPFR